VETQKADDMRVLTIDMHRLERALNDPGAFEHYLDLHSGQLIALDAEAPDLQVLHELEGDPERYAAILPLDSADRIAMREAFLFDLHDPHAHPLLAAALQSRRPLRTFGYELEQFPAARRAWPIYEKARLHELALNWLMELGLEPAAEAAQAETQIPEGIRRRLLRA